MPTYQYLCSNQKCNAEIEDTASMSSFKEHHPKCPKCESSMNYIWVPTVTQFILSDGPSGSWPSKGNRFKEYRQKQHEKVGKKQKERYGDGGKLVPNYAGKETESWAEAKELATKDVGKEAASSFDTIINKESAKKLT